MGFIAELARQGRKNTPADAAARGRAIWRQTFGIAKEDSHQQRPVRPVPGGSWGRGVLGGPSNDPAYRRLLEAMRSMAPGGWSDDRWEATKHFTGINYVAIHRTCLQLQRAEFTVYRKDPIYQGNKKPVRRDDPPEGDRLCKPYDLIDLLDNPNKQDSFGKWLYRIGQQRRLTGTALTWMVPNKLGCPMELYCIPTAIAIPQPAINPDFPDGYYRIQPVYPYGPFSSYPTPTTAVGAPIPAQWMLRMLYPHPLLRYDGFSPLTAMRLHADELEMMDRSRWYSMKRSINPSAVLDFPGIEDMQPLREEEIDRIHAEWENSFQGPENHGNLIVGTPGGELKPWGNAPKDMDYPNGWEQLTEFILGGGYGITKEAAGMLATSSYATLYAALKQLYWMTLEPEADDIGNDLTRHLAPFYGDDLVVKVHCKPIDDMEEKRSTAGVIAQHKAGTYNELREHLGWPKTKEDWGDKRIGGEELEQQEAAQQAQMGGSGQEALAGMGAIAMGGGMGGQQAGPEQSQQAPAQPGPANAPQEEPMQAPSLEAIRPKPGKLSEDSLGPRKELLDALHGHGGLNGHAKTLRARGKSFMALVQEELRRDAA